MMQSRKTLRLDLLAAASILLLGCETHADTERQAQQPPRNERPAWTPDGRHIVFSGKLNGNYDLFRMNRDGSGRTNLTNSPMTELFPAVSRSGEKVAFVGEADGNYDIYVMNIDGSEITRLTHYPGIDDWPSWRDDDATIIFDSEIDDSFAIMKMNSDGTGRQALVQTEAKTVDPMTTDASDWVVYSSDELDPGGNRQILAYNLISRKIMPLTNNAYSNGAPSLSADGLKIVFAAGDEYWDIYSMNTDGSNVLQLTSTDSDDRWGAWSPDGSDIAFTSNRSGGWEIYLMSADGGNVRRLTGNE